MSNKIKAPVPAAERMRRLRERRRNGLRSMRVLLTETDIDSLVDKGFCDPERRQDQAAIQSAIDGFICEALGWRITVKPTPVAAEVPWTA